MKLTVEEQFMLDGGGGPATQKAMQILAALGKIYERGMYAASYIRADRRGELRQPGRSRATIPLRNGGWRRQSPRSDHLESGGDGYRELAAALGIDQEFAPNQQRVIEAFARMGVITTCTCTPYLAGNLPHYGEHIAWAESSAVCFANSVIGARSNREGGPSALAAALTGRTPAYGMHLDQSRRPTVTFDIRNLPEGGTHWFGALGKAIGERLQALGGKPVAYIRGVPAASLEQLKSFSASLATYGGAAIFHMEGITPEAALYQPPHETIPIQLADLELAQSTLSDSTASQADFVSLGCPHLSNSRNCPYRRASGRQASKKGVLDHDCPAYQADR